MEQVKMRTLADPVFSKVTDIQPGKSGYNLYAKILSKTVLIDIKRIDGSRVVICDFLVGDDTGVIKMRLRNENFIDNLEEGKEIIIRNCKVPIIHSHIRIQVDAFGKVEISEENKVTDVKQDRNLSEDVYEHFTHSKGRFNPTPKTQNNTEEKKEENGQNEPSSTTEVKTEEEKN